MPIFFDDDVFTDDDSAERAPVDRVLAARPTDCALEAGRRLQTAGVVAGLALVGSFARRRNPRRPGAGIAGNPSGPEPQSGLRPQRCGK